jgi:hypothetical protein
MTPHLTHEQLCDLIIASSGNLQDNESQAAYDHLQDHLHDHLHDCLLCASELQTLRASLSLFRQATHSYARQEYARPSLHKASIAPAPGYLSHALYWAAAAAVAVAAILPVTRYRQNSPVPPPSTTALVSPQTTESDEALLEGIAQDLSTDVPSPMEPLADPTASGAVVQTISYQRKN